MEQLNGILHCRHLLSDIQPDHLSPLAQSQPPSRFAAISSSFTQNRITVSIRCLLSPHVHSAACKPDSNTCSTDNEPSLVGAIAMCSPALTERTNREESLHLRIGILPSKTGKTAHLALCSRLGSTRPGPVLLPLADVCGCSYPSPAIFRQDPPSLFRHLRHSAAERRNRVCAARLAGNTCVCRPS